MRFANFKMQGQVRFGGTVTLDTLFSQGFDHVVLALGAGLPRELPIAGSMASGMRQANDFLMALQLSGAHKNHLVSLQVDLPALVIGGGLTGVDTATEVKTYYIQQIKMIYSRYEYFVNNACESLFWEGIDQGNISKVKVYLEHAKSMYRWIGERGEASINDFIDSIGGVNIVYRKSYSNHLPIERIIKSLCML